MCKVLGIVGVTPTTQKAAWRFMLAAKKPMIKSNPHGLGYAAITPHGQLFGERWLESKSGFGERRSWNESDTQLINALGDAGECKVSYNAFGSMEHDNACAMILHTRYATCDHSMENTHPFIRNNIALIHNGVISNNADLTNVTSTCDSECILNEYVDKNVTRDPKQIQGVADKLRGSYACIVLNGDTQTPTIDLFRHQNPLVAARATNLGFTVFATNEEILRVAAKKAKIKLGVAFPIREHWLIRLDAITGDALARIEFTAQSSYSGIPTSAIGWDALDDAHVGSPATAASSEILNQRYAEIQEFRKKYRGE